MVGKEIEGEHWCVKTLNECAFQHAQKIISSLRVCLSYVSSSPGRGVKGSRQCGGHGSVQSSRPLSVQADFPQDLFQALYMISVRPLPCCLQW